MKPNNPKRTYTHCHGCGKRILLSVHDYCPDCAIIDARMRNGDLTAKGRKSFWAYLHEFGRRCCLSGVSLELDDNTGPWYLEFSRVNPGDRNKLAPAAALFRAMKSFFSKKQFRFYVLAIDDHREKHLKVKKIPLVNWHGYNLSKGERVCDGCRHAAALKRRKFCARCARLHARMQNGCFPREAIEGVWEYIRKYGFVCYYTGMELELDDFNSPWYLVFDHWMPRDPRKIVITSAVVNIMKSDLTEDEFWYFIRQLANYYRKGSPVRKRKLACWSRPYSRYR